MKQVLIDRISKRDGLTFLGCHRGSDSRCYYLCGASFSGAYGDNYGFDAYAYYEDHGDLKRGPFLRLRVTRTAMNSAEFSQVIGDKATYPKRSAVAHLKRMLESGTLDGEHEIHLRTYDGPAAFVLPHLVDPIVAQQRTRDDVLRRLAYLSLDGLAVVPYSLLLEGLCADPEWINRSLRILERRGLLKGIMEGQLVLTDAGHEEAEKLVTTPPSTPISVHPGKPMDCFVSYASEDRGMVQELVGALAKRDIQLWWDQGQITIGDRLSQKIDEGLRQSRYGLVVVSEHFIAKQWPQTELRALASRGINTNQKVVLPVLLDISHERFAEAYPLLSDIVSVRFGGDYAVLADEIVRAVNQ